MGSFTNPTVPASMLFTTKGATENANAIAGNTSFKLAGFSVGRDGYTTVDPTQITPVNIADTTLTDPIFPTVALSVSSIAWQSTPIVRYNLSGSPDLSGLSILTHLKRIYVAGATNTVHDGLFDIYAVNNVSKYIEVKNPLVTDRTLDEGAGATITSLAKFFGYEQPTPTDLVAVARLDRTESAWALGEVAVYFETVWDVVPANIGKAWIGCLCHFPMLAKTTDTVFIYKINIPLL